MADENGAPRQTGGTPTADSQRLRGQSRKSLEKRLDQLGAQLSGPDTSVDIDGISGMLLALAADIRSGSLVFAGNDYRWILTRLTHIYAQGFGQLKRDAFANTAADYAQVIETISREFPGHDYTEAVGQLLCYMSRLFRTRRSGWKAVYEHILSIPDSVGAKQLLNRAFFAEIQEWAEAGVENLFNIRRDLYEKIADIGARIEALDQKIEQIGGDQGTQGETTSGVSAANVVDLAAARRERQIKQLEHSRQKLRGQKEDEEVIVGLIESDILEFENKLRATRRAYFIRPV